MGGDGEEEEELSGVLDEDITKKPEATRMIVRNPKSEAFFFFSPTTFLF
jgi:hypothetical protein